jgi:glutamyl-tRNA reductase
MNRVPQRRSEHAEDGGHAREPAVSPTECARLVLQCRARHLGERELDRALSELELDDRERAAVETLVGRLVAGVLARPEAALRGAEDDAVAAVALALFAGE